VVTAAFLATAIFHGLIAVPQPPAAAAPFTLPPRQQTASSNLTIAI